MGWRPSPSENFKHLWLNKWLHRRASLHGMGTSPRVWASKHKFQERPSMQLFLKLFEPYLQWFYHCFDRIVINGYLSFLTRENNVAYFFREVCRKPKITKEVLLERTRDYQAWVQQYARNHKLPLLWPEKGVRKEDLVRPRQQRLIRQNRFGVYYILQSMEQGWTFRALAPKYPTQDPNFQFLRKHKSRYTHFYFYIVDEV